MKQRKYKTLADIKVIVTVNNPREKERNVFFTGGKIFIFPERWSLLKKITTIIFIDYFSKRFELIS